MAHAVLIGDGFRMVFTLEPMKPRGGDDCYPDCEAVVARFQAAGGDATLIHLPEMGITGNSHMLMQDKNNQEVADVFSTGSTITSGRNNRVPLAPDQQEISDLMIAHWTNFAAHGHPNGKGKGRGLPEWSAYRWL